jgi:hypothetical protein
VESTYLKLGANGKLKSVKTQLVSEAAEEYNETIRTFLLGRGKIVTVQ